MLTVRFLDRESVQASDSAMRNGNARGTPIESCCTQGDLAAGSKIDSNLPNPARSPGSA